MAEPTRAARLAWIRDTYGYDDIITELLDEIDRLNTEDPFVTAINQQLAKWKRAAIAYGSYVAAGLVVMNICTHLLGLPTWAGVVACFAAGALIGTGRALIEDRLEARRG